MTLTATCTHNGYTYEARLTHAAGRTAVRVSRDDIDAGKGRWWHGAIVECAATLPHDAYAALDLAVRAAINEQAAALHSAGDWAAYDALSALSNPTRC